MTELGYFARLGARVADMGAARPVMQPTEKLALDPAPEPAPQANASQTDVIAPQPEPFADRPKLAEDPAGLADASDTSPAAPHFEPVLPVDKSVPVAPQLDTVSPSLPPDQSIEQPQFPPTDVSPPPPQELQFDQSKDVTAQNMIPPQDTGADAAVSEDRPAPSPETDLSPEDHVAIFEGFIAQLNGHDAPEAAAPAIAPPAPPEPAPVTEIAPEPKPQFDAPQTQTQQAAPRLEIGEIIVEAPRAPHAPQNVPAPAPRRRAAGATRGMGRGNHGLGPL